MVHAAPILGPCQMKYVPKVTQEGHVFIDTDLHLRTVQVKRKIHWGGHSEDIIGKGRFSVNGLSTLFQQRLTGAWMKYRG